MYNYSKYIFSRSSIQAHSAVHRIKLTSLFTIPLHKLLQYLKTN